MKHIFHYMLMGAAAMGLGNAAENSSTPRDFPPNPIEKPGWILVAHDEFTRSDGGTLNPSLWIDGYFPGRFGDDYNTAKMPSNYEFRKEGETSFIVIKIPAGQPKVWAAGISTFNMVNWHKRYENTAVRTVNKFSSKYGYFEVRSRHPVAITGKDAAWWILDTRPQGDEIDVYEDRAYGGPNFHTKAVGPAVGIWTNDYPVTKKDSDVIWRVYGVEIYETGIRFYLNNKLIHERMADWSNISAWGHIFSLYSKDSKKGNEYHIDYFRAYRKINDANR